MQVQEKTDLKQMTKEEIRQSQIGILNYVDDICRENNLTYYLGAGTLIGAVRHKGYIPWDDDIDLFMKRDDYKKLIQLMGNTNNKFYLMSLQTTPQYYYPFVKVIDTRTKVLEKHMKQPSLYGVWVDVFPLDNYDENLVPEKKLKSLNFKLRMASQRKIYLSDSKLRNFIKRIIHLLYRFRDPNKIAKKVEYFSQCTCKETDKLYIGHSPVGEKDVYLSKWFSQVIKLEFAGGGSIVLL